MRIVTLQWIAVVSAVTELLAPVAPEETGLDELFPRVDDDRRRLGAQHRPQPPADGVLTQRVRDRTRMDDPTPAGQLLSRVVPVRILPEMQCETSVENLE